MYIMVHGFNGSCYEQNNKTGLETSINVINKSHRAPEHILSFQLINTSGPFTALTVCIARNHIT